MKNARNAVSYVRVSGLGQRDGDGPERQREAIARTAKRERLHMVKEYTDLGVSGTDPVKLAIMGAELQISGTNA